MQPEERLQIWIEQGSVNISQLFFHNYKSLGIKDIDAMLIMHLAAFKADRNDFPTPTELAARMSLTENEVSTILQGLMQRGHIQIKQGEDATGMLFEAISLQPLWNHLMNKVVQTEDKVIAESEKLAEGEIFSLFEQEFGRFLSPMETESISMWLDEDGHSVEIIRAALKEAVLADKVSLRYIDRILFEWKKKKVKTLSDVERQTKKFRTVGMRNVQENNAVKVKHVPFYNWLEERD